MFLTFLDKTILIKCNERTNCYDTIYPPHQAQQESPQRTGRQEAHNMGVFPGDEESREQENLQPQESRSCVEGRFQHERFLLHWGWYRGERRPWQHLNHVTGLQGGSTEPGCRIFLFVWYIKTQYRLVIHAVLCYNMLLSMYNYTLALKGAGIVIKNNVGIERKVMWIEAGTIQAKLAQVINTICSKCGSSYKYLSYGLSAEIRQKMCHELDKKDATDESRFFRQDSLFQYKNIVPMHVDPDRVSPVCPYCASED